jgi:hypothetical protein
MKTRSAAKAERLVSDSESGPWLSMMTKEAFEAGS